MPYLSALELRSRRGAIQIHVYLYHWLLVKMLMLLLKVCKVLLMSFYCGHTKKVCRLIQINTDRTKVMLFGDMVYDLKVTVNGMSLENVRSFKYLGVQLDPELNFTMQVDYAVAKAKRASAKVCSLIKDRKGISLSLAVQLYKSLVRPHMEYAIPVWTSLSDNDVKSWKIHNCSV